MNSESEIYLKCSLCDKSHQYEYSDSTFNAIEADWVSNDESFHLLASLPETGEKYIINLHPPLTIRTNEPFWTVYLNPISMLNGIESEQDLKDIRFCKCKTNKILKSNETSASIEIEVLETIQVDGLKNDFKPLSQWLTLMEDEDSFERHGATENFSNFSYIVINIQSDFGIDAIIKKENNKSYIVAINQWDFHINEWILCRIPLNIEDEKKFGIGYDI